MTTTHSKRARYVEHKAKSGPVIVVTKGEAMGEPTERLAALEHAQWVEWSKALAGAEQLSGDRLRRWQRLWATPYDQLTEDEKEQDRIWARRVEALLELGERWHEVSKPDRRDRTRHSERKS